MLLFSSELKLPCCDAAADNFHFGAVSRSHLLLSIMNVTAKILKIYFYSLFLVLCLFAVDNKQYKQKMTFLLA